MTYYGYKPADQDKSVIDWAGLTKTISDNLLAEKKRRDDTKVFLDQEHAQQLQKINEYEQGLDPQANTWMMEQIQSARDFMMENHRLMKRGIRGVNDKRLVDQNVMNTYTDLNNALKTYNSKIEALSKLPGKSNEALIDEMANFAQLRNRRIHNDPNTGAGYLVDVDPATGEINEKTLMPVRAINSIQQQSFGTVNVTDEVNKAVDKMGTWKVALSSTRDISNVRLNPKYQQTIDDLSKSILSSDEKKASVLLDYLDLDYSRDADDAAQGTITYDFITGYDEQGKPTIEERELNIGKVLMERGPDGKLKHTLTKEQEDLALEAIKSNIETKLLFETNRDYVSPTTTQGERADETVAGLIDKFVLNNDMNALSAALADKGFSGSLAPDENGIIRLKKGNQTFNVETTGKTAKQVGTIISGHLGVSAAYNKKSTAGSRALNKGVLDPSNVSQYTIFTKTTEVSKDIVDKITASMRTIQPKDFMGEPIPPDPLNVLATVQSAATELGLPSGSVTIDPMSRNTLMLNGNPIGVIGQTTGNIIAQALQVAAEESGAPVPDDDE